MNNKYSFSSANDVLILADSVFPADNSGINEMSIKYMFIVGLSLLDAAQCNPCKWQNRTNLKGIFEILTKYEDNFEEFINSEFISDPVRQKYYEYKAGFVGEEKNNIKFIRINIAMFLRENSTINI